MNNKLLIGIWLCIAFIQTGFTQEAIPGVQWQRTFGGSNYEGGAYSTSWDTVPSNAKPLLRTRDGGYIIGTKSSSSDGDVIGNTGSGRIWISKIDSNGVIQWNNFFGNILQPNVLGSVIEAVGGGYLMVGTARAGDDNLAMNLNADDVLVAKINEDGQIAWQKKYGGTQTDRGYAAVKSNNGGYLITGYTESSDGDATSLSKGSGDLWIVEIDVTGDIVRESKYGGSAADYGAMIKSVSDGGYIIGGASSSSNGDLTGSKGDQDAWILKLNANGSISWSKNFGGSSKELVSNVVADMDGGYVFSGITFSNNGDVSGNHGVSDAWIVKLSSSGNLVWQRCIGGTSEEVGSSLAVIPGPFYYLTGNTMSSNGNISGYKGGGDIFLTHIDPAGTVLWTKTFGGSGFESPYDILVGVNKQLTLLGETQSNDGDVIGNKISDMWLFKLASVNTISGRAFYDFNSNGIEDGTDLFADNVRIEVEKAGLKKSTLPKNGFYNIDVDLGDYTITPHLPDGYYTVVPSNTTKSFSTFFNTEVVNFALQPLPGKRDLKVSLFALTPARPGFKAEYLINYSNPGNTAIDARLELQLDSKLTVNSLSLSNTSVENGKLVWLFPGLLPGASGTIIIYCTIERPPAVNNGDTLKLITRLLPTENDLTVIDNVSKLNQVVVGSYDPNDKQESNAGIITPQQVNAGEPLTYLIRFQNTGTDTAFTVVIRDTLSSMVLPSSLRIVNASHPYNLEIKNDNQLSWTFNDIELVDSNRNEPLSHGFVAYQVKPASTLVVGDTVKNSASIYFDYNLPVITNTEITILKNLLALPLKIGYFKGVRSGTGVDLIWRVYEQTRFSHFEIERSADGKYFSKLGKRNAQASFSPASVIDYRYTDEAPLKANNYYRLKMVDMDGSFEYSHVVLLQSEVVNTVVLSVYPNPASQQVNVDIDGEINGHLSISIIDQLGRIQKTTSYGHQLANSIRLPVSVGHLPPGTYFLQIRLDEEVLTRKVIVK